MRFGEIEQILHRRDLPEQVYGNNRLWSAGDRFLGELRFDQQVVGIYVHKYRHRPDATHCLGGGDEGIGRDDHLVARHDTGRAQRKFECVGTVADTDDMLDTRKICVLPLELPYRWPADECTAVEHLLNFDAISSAISRC